MNQRLGQAFLGGRRAPTEEEMPAFLRSCGKEMADIWEADVNISEVKDTIMRPRVEYVEPMTRAEVLQPQTLAHMQV